MKQAQLVVISLSLLMVLFPLSLFNDQKTAHAASCYALSCDYKDPIAMGCNNDAVTWYSASIYRSGSAIGLLEVRFSSVCYAVWTRVTSSIGSNIFIGGYITRNADSSGNYQVSAGGQGTGQFYTDMAGRYSSFSSKGCVSDWNTCATINFS